MESTRPYDNRLRQEQAQATADRIMAALCELLIEDRPASVSIPAVAKRARVSVRTVYSRIGDVVAYAAMAIIAMALVVLRRDERRT